MAGGTERRKPLTLNVSPSKTTRSPASAARSRRVAVPHFDDRLRTRADAEFEPARSKVGNARGALRERRRPPGVHVRDSRPDAHVRIQRHYRERREAVLAINLERPCVGIAELLGLLGDFDVFEQSEPELRH